MHTAHALDWESARDAQGEGEGEGEGEDEYEEEEEEGATDAGAQLSPRAPPQCRPQKSECPQEPAAAKLSCELCQRQFENADALHFHYLRVHHSALPVHSSPVACIAL